ncbi:MAG: MoaD/ThiS family protein [Acidimicrobiales bacterium]
MVVRLASPLRALAGATCIEVDLPAPVTLGAVLDAVAAAYPPVGRRVRDETGAVRRHVNLFVGADNARDLGGLGTVVPAETEVAVLAAVSGGA